MAPPSAEHLSSGPATSSVPHQPEPAPSTHVLDDPFGSMYVGLIAPAAAVGAVVSGIFGLSIIY